MYKNIFNKFIIILLTISFFFYFSCAPKSILTKIQLEYNEVKYLKNNDKLFVITKDGDFNNIKNWKLTNTQLVGDKITYKIINKPISISLSDIDYYKINGIRIESGYIITEDELKKNIKTHHRIEMSIINPLIYMTIGFFPSIMIGFILGSPFGNDEEQMIENGLNKGLTIWGISTLYSSYLGYQWGKFKDHKKALDKIKQTKLKEK